MSSNSTTSKPADKAAVLAAARQYKRENHLPLTVHPGGTWGRWCKKVNGRQHHFGPIVPEARDYGSAAALAEFHRTIDCIQAGRKPRPKDDDLITLRDAVNAFLSAKAAMRDTGELTPRSWTNYHGTCGRIVHVLGKHRAVADLDVADFRKLRTAFAKGRGPVSLGNEVRHSRIFFKWCYDEGLIDRPVRYGQAFDLPTPKTLRLARAARGPRMFEAAEVRLLLDKAGPVLKAQILLAINAAFGQSDLARLPKSAIEFKTGWIDHGRQKTGIARRCPLWEATIAAVKAAIEVRPEPKDAKHNDLVFLTPTGLPVVRDVLSTDKQKAAAGLTTPLDTIAPAFKKLMRAAKLDGNRAFYALRHTFQTIAEQTGDFPAVSAIMGHAPRAGDMSAVYRERIDDARLVAVTNHVRAWLWPRRRVVRRKKATR